MPTSIPLAQASYVTKPKAKAGELTMGGGKRKEYLIPPYSSKDSERIIQSITLSIGSVCLF